MFLTNEQQESKVLRALGDTKARVSLQQLSFETGLGYPEINNTLGRLLTRGYIKSHVLKGVRVYRRVPSK